MKRYIFILFLAAIMSTASCTKEYRNYPDGYDKIYYVSYDYDKDDKGNPVMANRTISADKFSQELIPLPIKFFSETERDEDIEVRLYVRNSHWFLTQLGVMKAPDYHYSTPDSLAVPGIDFNILDSERNMMTPERQDTLTFYRLKFPKAHKEVRTLYVQLLGNEDHDHVRSAWLSLSVNPVRNSSEEELYATSLNYDMGAYRTYSLSRSYLRRIDIK